MRFLSIHGWLDYLLIAVMFVGKRISQGNSSVEDQIVRAVQLFIYLINIDYKLIITHEVMLIIAYL